MSSVREAVAHRRVHLALSLWLLCAPVAADVPVGEGAQRLDGVAAVVGALAPGPDMITILRSDVSLRARLALLGEGSLRDALGPLPQGLLRASLAELVGEALIAHEANRLNLAVPTAAALAAQRDRLLGAGDAAATRELLRALGVTERELGRWIERRAIVNGFLEANLEGTLEASASELERAFQTEPHPFRDQTFEEARSRFAAWLAQQRTERAVARWVESLSQRIPHRVLVDY